MSNERVTVEEVYGYGSKGERHAVLFLPAPRNVHIVLDSPDWFAWLEEATTTSFSYAVFDPVCGYIVGWMSVNKEHRQRGGWYWRVARRVGRRVRKVYLGPPTAVTDARLRAIAASFLERTEPSNPSDDT